MIKEAPHCIRSHWLPTHISLVLIISVYDDDFLKKASRSLPEGFHGLQVHAWSACTAGELMPVGAAFDDQQELVDNYPSFITCQK